MRHLVHDSLTDHAWLWNDLLQPSFFLARPKDLAVLLELGPPDTPVWLIVEDFASAKVGPPFWLFEATLEAAVSTLKNHYPLEFCVVSRRLDWLVGENHHDVLFASGAHAVSVLQALAP